LRRGAERLSGKDREFAARQALLHRRPVES
jgi:hypothetical protein